MPFVVRHSGATEEQGILLARAVIDASGTYSQPNPLGAEGVPAFGEGAAHNQLFYGIPEVLGADRPRYANRRIAVVGSGQSALNALVDLDILAGTAAGTRLTWIVRRSDLQLVFGGGANDRLPARGELGARVESLVSRGCIQVVTGFATLRVVREAGALLLASGQDTIGPFDEVVAATGFRPDHTFLRELRVEVDPWLEPTPALAPLIDPNVHSCGTVRPHGAQELAHPERDFPRQRSGAERLRPRPSQCEPRCLLLPGATGIVRNGVQRDRGTLQR